MSQLELFAKRLQELQDEMGVHLHLATYKSISTGEYCKVLLSADEERSVHMLPLLELELDKNKKLRWCKHYAKKRGNN